MEPLVQHSLCDQLALIIAPAGPMNDQDIRSRTAFGVLDVAIGRGGDGTLAADPMPRLIESGTIVRRHQNHSCDQRDQRPEL